MGRFIYFNNGVLAAVYRNDDDIARTVSHDRTTGTTTLWCNVPRPATLGSDITVTTTAWPAAREGPQGSLLFMSSVIDGGLEKAGLPTATGR